MTATDLANVTWRRSTRSSANGSDCVEVGEMSSGFAVRDSKDPDGPALLFDRDAWSSFVTGLRRGPVG
ncbi:DUF397 domain-containing protein [Micromonospora sp. NPDC005215]|uniref:DUF397 domain-containing protein n=1 Tax=Micromonospora sp. NPDC005215 TaxID=3157024 RepID=UPI0033A74738